MKKSQIKEFFKRLEGKEGCNFQGEGEKINWRCKGGNNKDLSIAILKRMKIPLNEMVEFLCQCNGYGGYCDCEIIFNAKDHF